GHARGDARDRQVADLQGARGRAGRARPRGHHLRDAARRRRRALSSPPFRVLRLGEVEAVPVGEALQWLALRRELGVRAFGVNAYRAGNAGDDVVEDHDETGSGAGGHEELYVVLSGHARFTVAGEELDAPSGTVVFVRDPAARRHAVAQEAGATVLAVGGAAGGPYSVSAWGEQFA